MSVKFLIVLKYFIGCDDELDDIFQYLCPIEINNNTVFESPFEFPLLEDELSINLDHEDVEKMDQERIW